MTWNLRVCCFSGALALLAGFPRLLGADDTPQPDAKTASQTAPAYDILLFGPRQPLLLRIVLRIDGVDATGTRPELIGSEIPQQPGHLETFAAIDSDRDGRLSKAELKSAWTALRRFDWDDDETVGLNELLAVDGDRATPQTGMERRSGFYVLEPGETIEELARLLLQQYGSERGPAGTRGLDANWGPVPRGWVQFDRNSDSALDQAELISLLQAPVPHAELVVDLPLRNARRSASVSRRDVPSPQKPGPDPKLTARFDQGGVNWEFQARSTRNAAGDAGKLYRLEFYKRDADKNRYLDETEFATLEMKPGEFAEADADGDGMVFAKEFNALVDKQLQETAPKLQFKVKASPGSLFAELDADRDFRLSVREVRRLTQVLRDCDVDHDGFLNPDEFFRHMQGTISWSAPGVLERDAVTGPGNTAPVVTQRIAGPAWFRKMDRNVDGDVSPREFLGTADKFQKWDTDGDGLLSAEEAEAVDNLSAHDKAQRGPRPQSHR